MPNGRNKPNANRIALEGRTFGRWHVLRPIKKPGVERIFYECRCECGTVRVVNGQQLRLGATKSCGCYHRELSAQINYQHGMSRTSAHNVWSGMIQRCEDPNCAAYSDYGGRGITVCAEWHDFLQFFADMGFAEKGMTIDRINNDGPYAPGNCRWADRTAQANNRRSNVHYTFQGVTRTQREWERHVGLRRGQLYDRLHKGWSLERALTMP